MPAPNLDLEAYRSLSSAVKSYPSFAMKRLTATEIADILRPKNHQAGKAVIAYMEAHVNEIVCGDMRGMDLAALPMPIHWIQLASHLDQHFLQSDQTRARQGLPDLAMGILGIKAGKDFAEFFKTYELAPTDLSLPKAGAQAVAEKLRIARESSAEPACRSAQTLGQNS